MLEISRRCLDAYLAWSEEHAGLVLIVLKPGSPKAHIAISWLRIEESLRVGLMRGLQFIVGMLLVVGFCQFLSLSFASQPRNKQFC
jgi:hypothetical protein